jgi:hypothetical protein
VRRGSLSISWIRVRAYFGSVDLKPAAAVVIMFRHLYVHNEFERDGTSFVQGEIPQDAFVHSAIVPNLSGILV